MVQMQKLEVEREPQPEPELFGRTAESSKAKFKPGSLDDCRVLVSFVQRLFLPKPWVHLLALNIHGGNADDNCNSKLKPSLSVVSCQLLKKTLYRICLCYIFLLIIKWFVVLFFMLTSFGG
jgi:hypothetical protein